MTGQEIAPGGWPLLAANVLVVDDQPGKLLTYRAVLEGIDAELSFVGSAREALDQLLRYEFAVVIVDVCMPDLDGFELAQMIREHPRCKRTAIIFASGVHLTEFDRLKGYEVGAVDYLPVPIVPEILRAKVNVFLDLYRKTCELENLNRGLEERVAERTEELERAGRQKDEFLAVLAHELRNPLAAIRSATHLIATPGAPAAATAKASAVINRQVGHLVRLIDDLVDISRITRGIVQIARVPVSMRDVLAQATEASKPAIDARGHVLSTDIADGALVVDGDLTRLAQVVTNVLNNAAKFTEPGGHITIHASAVDGKAVLRVSDTGVGIAPELLGHVFDLFTQGQPLLDRTSSGLGIGLALVRQLIDLHGGSVSIASDGLGRGTTVTVSIPLASEQGSADEARPCEETSTPEMRTAGWLPKVLVVDDNVDAAEALAMFLRLSGYHVLTADDGVEALRVGATLEPEVILLDLGMPRLNGFEAARRIRELAWGKQTGLVALTGWGQEKDFENTISAGFDAHLVKPVGHEELMHTLTQVTDLYVRRARPVTES